MRKHLVFAAGMLVASSLLASAALSQEARRPENELAGIRLGRSFRDVLRVYGGPNEIRTVAVPSATGMAPGVDPNNPYGAGAPGMDPGMAPGGFPGGAPGATGMPGMPGAPGAPGFPGGPGGFPGAMPGGSSAPGLPGGSPYGPGASPYGPGASPYGPGAPGAPPVLPPAVGGAPGAPGYPGAEGGMAPGAYGDPSQMAGYGQPTGPEYSSALMWVYKKGTARLEFLINEDGRVAQISVAAPAKKPVKTISALRGSMPVKTREGITLGSSYGDVVRKYSFPERTRVLMGGRFDESYYTRNYHAAFTVDALESRRVVRITITLAD
jgi:hypothetical protein